MRRFDFDVITIGAGPLGTEIASHLSAAKKKVGLVSLAGNPETYFERLLQGLSRNRYVSPSSLPSNHSSVKKFEGSCTFNSSHELTIGNETVTAAQFVLASGCRPVTLDVDGLREKGFKDPVEFLKNKFPRSVLIIGAGPVGISLARLCAEQKSQVTLIFDKKRILPCHEPEISDHVKNKLESLDVQILPWEEKRIKQADQEIVVAAGVRANSDGLGLERAGVYVRKNGCVMTSEDMRTSASHIWAAGEITGPPFHYSLSRYQAELVTNNIYASFFAKKRIEPEPLPFSLPTHPPLAWLGMTESEARKEFKDVMTAHVGDDEGTHFIKMVGRKRFGRLLGAQIVGPQAGAMILFFDLVMRADISLVELTDSHHFPAPGPGDLIHQCLTKWIRCA